MKKMEQGLSLIEVLVALSIISIVFLALAMSQVFGFRTARDSLEASTARDLASRQIEVIRSYGYASYAGCPTSMPSGTVAPICSGSETDTSNPGYTVAWEITNAPPGIPTTTPPALLGVRVETQYGPQSNRRAYTLASYLSCADAGNLSVTNVPCPETSLLP